MWLIFGCLLATAGAIFAVAVVAEARIMAQRNREAEQRLARDQQALDAAKEARRQARTPYPSRYESYIGITPPGARGYEATAAPPASLLAEESDDDPPRRELVREPLYNHMARANSAAHDHDR